MGKLLIIGTRTYEDKEEFCKIISEAIKRLHITEIVSGGANGADMLAKIYATENKILYTEFLANWEIGKAAGFVRNEQMHKYISQSRIRYVIAFWDGKSKGTAHSFDLAKKYNNKLFVYNYVKKSWEI